MITVEIAGYTFDTENWCPECMAAWARLRLMDEGYWQTTGKTTEELLTLLAGLLDIDRDCADSDEFPVPFSGQQAETDASRAAFDGEHAPRCQCGNDFTGEF